MKKSKSQILALCGILGAFSVVILLVGNLLQIGTYAAPMLSSFLLVPILEEYGKKYAFLHYICVSILSLFLVPDKELVFFYVMVMGYYPILYSRLNRIKPYSLCITVKLLFFTCTSVLLYLFLFFIFMPQLLESFSSEEIRLFPILLILGCISFLIYDLALKRLIRYYKLKLHFLLKRSHLC